VIPVLRLRWWTIVQKILCVPRMNTLILSEHAGILSYAYSRFDLALGNHPSPHLPTPFSFAIRRSSRKIPTPCQLCESLAFLSTYRPVDVSSLAADKFSYPLTCNPSCSSLSVRGDVQPALVSRRLGVPASAVTPPHGAHSQSWVSPCRYRLRNRNPMFVRVEVWKSGRPATAMWS
jgi:hypothetical protein